MNDPLKIFFNFIILFYNSCTDFTFQFSVLIISISTMYNYKLTQWTTTRTPWSTIVPPWGAMPWGACRRVSSDPPSVLIVVSSLVCSLHEKMSCQTCRERDHGEDQHVEQNHPAHLTCYWSLPSSLGLYRERVMLFTNKSPLKTYYYYAQL